MEAIWSREIAAGVEPARRNEQIGTITGCVAHEVSILPGVGRQLGWQPRANTSMTIMRAARAWAGQHPRRIRRDVLRLLRIVGRLCDTKESTGCGDALSTIGVGEEPIVADAVEALG